MRSILGWGLLLGLCVVPAARGEDNGRTDRPDAVAARLRALEQEMSNGHDSSLLKSLTASWDVETPDGHYSISTQKLREYLESSDPDAAKQWLENAAEQLDGWQAASGNPVDARAKLTA